MNVASGFVLFARDWLIDLALLSTLLLAVALLVVCATRQPIARLIVIRATLLGLLALVVLVALPGWPRVVLWTPPESLFGATSDSGVVVPPSNSATQSSLVPRHGASSHDDSNTAVAPVGLVEQGSTSIGSTTVGDTPGDTVPGTVGAVNDPNRLLRSGGELSVSTAARVLTELSLWFAPASLVVVIAYLAGFCLALCWMAGGAYHAFCLLRHTTPATAELTRELHRITGDATGGVRLLMSDSVPTAMAMGVVRPTIVLPTHVADDRQEARAAIVHEWAHVYRGDLLVLALGRLLMVVLYAQPLFWMLRRVMRDDQETLADAAAARAMGRDAYASQLLRWARRHADSPRPGISAAIGLWDRPSRLAHRIHHLLGDAPATDLSIRRRWRVLAIVGIGLLAFSLSTLTLSAHRIDSAKLVDVESIDLVAAEVLDDGPIERADADNADLAPSFDINGRVYDANGGAVSGARVVLLDLSHDRQIATTTSDADGEYSFRSPTIVFTAPDLFYSHDYVDIAVVAHSDEQGLAWEAGGRLQLSSLDRLSIRPFGQSTFHPVTSLPSSAGGGETVRPQTRINTRFSEKRWLAGRVVDVSGHPVTGVSLKLVAIGQPHPADTPVAAPSLAPARLAHAALASSIMTPVVTDAEGRWRLDNLPADVWVELTVSGDASDKVSTFAATSPVAADHHEFEAPLPTDVHDVVLPATQPIVLSVRDSLDGTAVAGIVAEIDQQIGTHQFVRVHEVTDDNGQINVALPTGEYEVRLSPPRGFTAGLPYRSTERNIAVVDSLATQSIGLDVEPGSVVELRVVDDATGVPLPDVRIRARNVGRERSPFWNQDDFNKETDGSGIIRAVLEPAARRFYIADDDIAITHGYRVVEAAPDVIDLAAGDTYRHTFRLQEVGAPFVPIPDDDVDLAGLEHQAAAEQLRRLGVAVTTRFGIPGGAGSVLMTHAVVTPLWSGNAANLVDLWRLDGLTALMFVDSGVAPPDRSPEPPVVHDDVLALLRDRSLQSLVIQRSDITATGLAVLPTVRGLMQLTFHSNELTDDAFVHVGDIEALSGLTITTPYISDKGLAHLASLEQLRTVRFNTEQPIVSGIAQLSATSASQLRLHASDRVLEEVTALPALTRLSVHGVGVTDAGIAHLVGSRLTNLAVTESSPGITDESIEHFSRMPRLTRLVLTDTSVTMAGVARLERLRPDLDVRLEAREPKGDMVD